MRTPDQIAIDRALLVYLLQAAEPHGLLSDVKLQQLAFLCELQMFNKGLKGFHFEFFRYAYGAFSKDLDNDLLSLRKRGRVENYSVSEQAQGAMALIQESAKGVEGNEQVLELIDAVVSNYAPQDTGAITNSVEAVELSTPQQPELKLAIRDIPFHSTLLVPHRIEVKTEFAMSPQTLARLNAALGY